MVTVSTPDGDKYHDLTCAVFLTGDEADCDCGHMPAEGSES